MQAFSGTASLCMEKKIRAYIIIMNWKEKLKWKLLIIAAALAGILIVWCAGKAGERKADARKEVLKEYAKKENEWASAGVKFQPPRFENAEEKMDQTDITDKKNEEEPKKGEVSATKAVEAVSETQTDKNQESYGSGPVIQVLLMTDGYKSYYHEKVSLKVQGAYELQGAEKRQMADRETLNLQADSPELAKGSLSLVPLEADCRIQVLSLNRGQGNPLYRGSLTVYRDKEGLRLVNTLPLENYLCGVVPSEMPASYPEEALKAQTVCARTYASVQMQESKLADLGAQVDDSVGFQVYQNSPEAESSSRAVRDTAGKILLNNGAPICAYYFSTSHGKTSTDEVWEASAPSSYLQSVECSYDAEEPWYQWTVSVKRESILEHVQQTYPGVQTVEKLEIQEKGEGEAVQRLAVYTDKGVKVYSSEYDIRTLLAPVGETIVRQDGSEVKESALLPSAYFDMKEERGTDNTLLGWRIEGGGYGHGVGMSQNGARGMAKSGKSWEEILTYFYKDIEIGNLAQVVNQGNS